VTKNKGQSNLTKGDIARPLMSISSIMSCYSRHLGFWFDRTGNSTIKIRRP